MISKSELRRQIRQRRRALSPRERELAAGRLAAVLVSSPAFRRARRVACFLSNDGEIDTGPLLLAAWGAGKQLYLPVLAPFGRNRLWFRPYTPHAPLAYNRYGIAEPAAGRLLPARRLDLVLAPLVAFDGHGHRLGMGGGYYDRTFSYLHHRRRWQKPRLIGVAYAFQEVAALPAEPWDVPLWGIATEDGLRRFSSNTETA